MYSKAGINKHFHIATKLVIVGTMETLAMNVLDGFVQFLWGFE